MFEVRVKPRVGVIAVGGKGLRMQPLTRCTPKVMLQVGGKSLLTRQLELMRDMLGISRVFLVVDYLQNDIRRRYGTGSDIGLDICYVENHSCDGGLGTVLIAVEPHITGPFVLFLGDELYLNTNHDELLELDRGGIAVCGIHPTNDLNTIRKNYAVEIENGFITKLIEKPTFAPTPFVGCGTFVLEPSIFAYSRETKPSVISGKLELIDILNHASSRGAPIIPFILSGQYCNVNTVDDLLAADRLARLHGDVHELAEVL